MATTRRLALGATLALALAAAVAAGLGVGDGRRSEGGPASAAGASAAGTPTATPGAPGSPTPGVVSRTRGPRPTPGGAAVPGVEALPTPAGEPTATDYRLPPAATRPAPLLGARLPRPGFAKGRLVAGFPVPLGPPEGTAVESTSVTVADAVLQAALVATGGDPLRVILHYRRVLGDRGFAEHPAQGVENDLAATFTNGEDNVTVTMRDGTTYLLAQLRPTSDAR